MPEEKLSEFNKSVDFNEKKILGIILAIIAIVVSLILPETDQITVVVIKTVGLLIAFLVMLITEALPIVVISLFSCALKPLLGIVPGLGRALVGFSEPIVFFVLASYDPTRSFGIPAPGLLITEELPTVNCKQADFFVNYFKALRGEEPFLVKIPETRRVLAVMEACHKSAETMKSIDFE